MVSELSERLLSGSSVGLSSDTSSSKCMAKSVASTQATSAAVKNGSSGSGYAADSEPTDGATPPPYVDMMSRHKRRVPASSEERATRRKMHELNYIAATAKVDLARAGKEVPALRRSAPRCLPSNSGIDLSKVLLLKSSVVSHSPFLAPHATPLLFEDDSYADTLLGLLKSSESLYLKYKEEGKEQAASSSDTESSTSSVSDTDSDENEAKAKPTHVTMGEALAFSNFARIIAVAESPYTVVHVNGAFTKITGIPAVKVVGHPFHDLLEESVTDDTFKTTFQFRSMNEIHEQILDFKGASSKDDSIPFRMTVSPVGTQPQRITHVALQLDDLRKARESMEVSTDEMISLPEKAESAVNSKSLFGVIG